jgi:hypothetical protein
MLYRPLPKTKKTPGALKMARRRWQIRNHLRPDRVDSGEIVEEALSFCVI